EQRSTEEWCEYQVETKVAHDSLPRSPSLRRDVGEHRCTERLVWLLRPAALVDELSIGERVDEPASGDAPRADVVEPVRVAATARPVIAPGREGVVLVPLALQPIVRARERDDERNRERRL